MQPKENQWDSTFLITQLQLLRLFIIYFSAAWPYIIFLINIIAK